MTGAAAAARHATHLPTPLLPHASCFSRMCGYVVGGHVVFAQWLFALSYVRFALRSLVCPLRPSLSRMSSGAVRALVLLSCRLPPLVLQAYLDTKRVALAHTCSAAVSRCSCSSGLVVSRLLSLVLLVCCLTSLVLSCLVAYLPYMPYGALKAFRRR